MDNTTEQTRDSMAGEAEQRTVGASEGRAYEPPVVTVVGSVHSLTLTGGRCWWGKKWGGVDGIEFMNISIPVSSC